MIKINLTLEMEEEQLRDIFESYDIKFTKKKAKELNRELQDNLDTVIPDFEEAFEEIIGNWLNDMFDE